VQLALTASAIVVLPASANTISSAALGLAATPAQTTLLASPSPVLYFPHMNPVMWNKAVIQRRAAELRAQGDTVVAPIETVTYHMWKGAKDVGLSLPDPDEAAAIVRGWIAVRAGAVEEPA
jgi:phosphopantothenoylcysteine synthetase/decarboxylase